MYSTFTYAPIFFVEFCQGRVEQKSELETYFELTEPLNCFDNQFNS